MANASERRSRLVSVPLRGPLTVVFVLLVIGTTIAAGWVSYRAAFRSVEDEAMASLMAATGARDHSLSAAVARKRERLQSTLQSVELGCGITGIMVTPCAREMLRPFLRAEHAYGASLYYGGREPLRVGNFIGQGLDSATGLPMVQAGPKNNMYVTLAYSDRESALTLAVDFSVASLVSTTELLRAQTRVVTRTGGQDYVVAESGAHALEGPLVVPQLGGCLEGAGGWTIHDRQYLSFRPSQALADTCVAALRDEQEITAPILRLKARIARVGVAFAVLALALAYLLAWLVARPLTRLQRRVRGLRKGDYDSPVPIVGVGEVRELALAFASMKDSVKAHRETIAENERRLAMVYKAAHLWIWEYDLVYGEITWQNPAEERVPRKTTLRAFLRRVHPEDRHLVCDAIRQAKSTGIYDAEYRISRRQEPFVWMSSWGQVIGILRRRMIGVSLDVSARKNAEIVVREKDRLEASAEIAGSLAHEINNPLTAIMGALYMLNQRRLSDPAIARYVDIADKETRRVAQLANQILGLYRKPAASVAIDIRSLLEEVVAGCQQDLEAKRQRVLMNCERGIISGHRQELAHAFSNILRNAIESCPAGAEIRIRAHHAHRWRPNTFGIRVLIADHGPGIPARELAQVFKAFTGTKSQKGTGLGLWVARSAVVTHGGTIRIRVAQGKRSGTVVSIFLPARTRGKPATSAPRSAAGNSLASAAEQ